MRDEKREDPAKGMGLRRPGTWWNAVRNVRTS